jgi:hypothetical protein
MFPSIESIVKLYFKEGVIQHFIFSWNKELSSLIYRCTILLVYHAFFTGRENIGPHVKVMVPNVKVLGPGCKSTGLRTWKYWFPDVEVLVPGCVKLCQEMMPEKLRPFLRKMKSYG